MGHGVENTGDTTLVRRDLRVADAPIRALSAETRPVVS
jgi:hypothetical protein